MKFTLFALAALFSAVSAAVPNIDMKSDLGQHLLTKARRVEDNNNNNNYNYYNNYNNQNWEEENNWVSTYSVKFQGCHHIKQWNDEADGEEDVRIATKRLIRFRLCPSDSCSANKAAGCSKSYGDYVIDMDIFMEAWMEATRREREYQCEYHLTYNCDCEDDGNKDDNWNEEYCEYDCFVDSDMSECIDRNPYEDDEQQEQFDVEEYMQCRELNIDNNNNNNNYYYNNGNRRRLDGQVQFFVGPFCAQQGGEVHLGLFTDDTCTTYAQGVTFEGLMGFELPYGDESIVGAECLKCVENEDVDQQNQNDQQDADEVSESCEMLYVNSGKCESNLPEGTTYSPNENACNYMEGIRVTRQDGIIDTGSSRPSAAATAFIVIFAMAFAAMAFYVWYLRTRLGVKQNSLL